MFVCTGNLKDFLSAAQLSGNVPRTVNSQTDRNKMAVFDPGADPKKSKDSQKIRDKVRGTFGWTWLCHFVGLADPTPRFLANWQCGGIMYA